MAGQTYTHHYLHNILRLVLTYLYGHAVALLYTWHSFRSGLATALHAANVPDDMIMLICRWMCPESLHVYRRMGTREHERLINEASTMNVDAIQSTNVVRVVGDQGYASLFADIQLNSTSHSRDFSRAASATSGGAHPRAPAEEARPTTPVASKRPRARAPSAKPPKAPARRAHTQDAPSSDEEHPSPLQSLAARASTSVVPIGVSDLSDHTVEASRPSSRKAPTQRHRS